MKGAPGLVATVTLSFIVGACAAATAPTPLATLAPAPTLSATPTQGSTPTASSTALIQDMMAFEPSVRLGPERTSSTPTATPPPHSAWCTRFPRRDGRCGSAAAKFSDAGHVGVSITTVANLVTDGCTRPFVGRSTGRTERRRPRRRAGGPGPVPGDVAAEGRDRLRLPREASGMDRARPAGRGGGRRPTLHRMRRRQPQELGRVHRHDRTRGRVLRLHRARLHARSSGSSTSRGPV